MTKKQLAFERLQHQNLVAPATFTPASLVEYMGAMQAQDIYMSHWAIGCRVKDCTQAAVLKCIQDGSIIRTHVLRPTWHLVSPKDIRWMLELSASNIKRLMRSNEKLLGISESTFIKTNKLIEKLASKENWLTRNLLTEHFSKAKIDIRENRLSHYLVRAELDMIICSAGMEKNRHVYTAFEDRIPKTKPFSKEEALVTLAERYIKSHGPVTIRDFSWWSGLSITDATEAVNLVQDKLEITKLDSTVYYRLADSEKNIAVDNQLHLLPAFDEFIIAYANRDFAIENEHQQHTFTKNGIFKPVMVYKGKVVGTWSRELEKSSVIVTLNFFGKQSATMVTALKKAAKTYGHFLGEKVEIKF